MKWIDKHYGKAMAVIITLMSIGMAIIVILQLGLDLGWWQG